MTDWLTKPVTLYSTLTGSRLYGTNTPTSDRDETRLIMPSFVSLLRGEHALTNLVHKTNETKARNSAEDTDINHIPLQVFARDFLNGQTYAIDLAYSIDSNHAEQRFDPKYEKFTRELIKELRSFFLTKSVKAMLGYVLKQANTYSFKGERLNAALAFQDVVNKLSTRIKKPDTLRFGDFVDTWVPLGDLEGLINQYPKYIERVEYDIGSGKTAPAFKLLNKTLPLSTSLEITKRTVNSLVNKYGERTKTASESNVDWKAMMHAVRIADQGLAIMQTGKVIFPVPPIMRKRYLAIRAGHFLVEAIRDEIEKKLGRLERLEAISQRPSPADIQGQFNIWLDNKLIEFYTPK